MELSWIVNFYNFITSNGKVLQQSNIVEIENCN